MQLESLDRSIRKPSIVPGPLAFAAVLLGLLSLATSARAEFFTFSTGVTPASKLTPGGVTITLTPQSVNTPGDNLDATTPGTDLVFGAISVSGLTLGSSLESVTIPYTFQVSLSNYLQGTDAVPTGPPVVFNIGGTLNGTVGAGKKVNIANAFSQTSILQIVDGEAYQFSNFSYVPPGIANAGAFGAHVEIVRVPEPASAALLAGGILILATPAFRRWRRNAPRTSG